MKNLIRAGIATAVVAASVGLAASPAYAEYRSFPGVNCQGYAYTTARTSAQFDQSNIGKYNSQEYDAQTFGPNETGAIQVHTNYTRFHRSNVGVIQTGRSTDYYLSSAHACDN